VRGVLAAAPRLSRCAAVFGALSATRTLGWRFSLCFSKMAVMPAETFELSRGLIMVIVSGKLSHEELIASQAAAIEVMKRHDKVRLLCLVEDFEGWEQTERWGDLSFQEANDERFEKMALVGDPKWKTLVLTFVGAGLRVFPIRYFAHGEVGKAREWLRS
jgi:hypothetical protein